MLIKYRILSISFVLRPLNNDPTKIKITFLEYLGIFFKVVFIDSSKLKHKLPIKKIYIFKTISNTYIYL